MEIFVLGFYVIVILLIWWVVRIFGAIFRGPRWRRRQARKNWDYTDWLLSRQAVRRSRRDRW